MTAKATAAGALANTKEIIYQSWISNAVFNLLSLSMLPLQPLN